MTIYPDVEWIISIDINEKDNREYYELSQLKSVTVLINDSGTAISAINNAAKIAKGDYLVVISDDFELFWGWDAELWKSMQGKSDFCAKTIDGHQDWIITLPIMDRKYYERFGYVYHPDYKHMFADLEMTCVAWMLDKYIKLPIEFKHNHYRALGQSPDGTNIRNNSTWRQGQNLFRDRMKNNFGIENPINAIPNDIIVKQFI